MINKQNINLYKQKNYIENNNNQLKIQKKNKKVKDINL